MDDATATLAAGKSISRSGRQINPHVQRWVEECAEMCEPRDVYWCDGSVGEKQRLTEQAVRDGVLIRLNQQKLPNCYLHRSNPNDVARSEQLTFICTPSEDMAGPTNNWMETRQAYAKLRRCLTGCMRGRTMYVVPFVMGPLGSPLAKVGVQLTRFDLRRHQHGDHDAHGRMRLEAAWATATSSRAACTGWAT